MKKTVVAFLDVPSGFEYHLEHCAIDGIYTPFTDNMQKRSIDINFDVDLKIAIDLTKITAAVAAAWIIDRITKLKQGSIPCDNPTIQIDGNETRIDHTEIVKRLEYSFNRNNSECDT